MGWGVVISRLSRWLFLCEGLSPRTLFSICVCDYSSGDLAMKTLRMSDIGTRLDHLMELQELWSIGVAIARKLKDQGSYQAETERKMEEELEIALKLLAAHMQKDFPDTDYAREINNLPKNPTDIV
jgi:hypothetical protein